MSAEISRLVQAKGTLTAKINIQQGRALEGLPVAPLSANPSWAASYFAVLAEAGVLERQNREL